MDSPRGRIYLIKKATDGEAAIDEFFRGHMDNCLGCMACVTACPSGVRYDRLIEPTRAQIERKLQRSWSDSLLRSVIFSSFPYPSRLRKLLPLLRLYQMSGFRWLIRKSGVLRYLPKRLAAMEALLPRLRSEQNASGATVVAAQGFPRRRVAMLSGCVQQVFFSHVNAATLRVLSAEGCEVVIPPDQGCCGALMLHSGLNERGTEFAKRMIETFEDFDVDTIVINSAGCGSTMKEYGRLLKDDPLWANRAHSFAMKCKDISELLAELDPLAPRKPLNLRIAYHDACHLQHGQRVHHQPRQVLRGVPGLEIAEVSESSLCCGSAGVYNLLHPETADQLGDRKVDNLLATRSEAVVSANPGCLLQLMHGLRRRGMKEMPAFHMIELVDASIRGVSKNALLQNRSQI